MSAPAPIEIWRDPTRRDVEELCEVHGGELVCEHGPDHGMDGCPYRDYYIVGETGARVHLGHVVTPARPDWRAMLQKLGSDWA